MVNWFSNKGLKGKEANKERTALLTNGTRSAGRPPLGVPIALTSPYVTGSNLK
jgi:hypothetical protein